MQEQQAPPMSNGTSIPYHGSPVATHGVPAFAASPIMLAPSRVSVSIDWSAVQSALTLALGPGSSPQNMTPAGPRVPSTSPAVPYVPRSAELWPQGANGILNGDASLSQPGPSRLQPPVEERNGVLLLPREVKQNESDPFQSVGAAQPNQHTGQLDSAPTAFAHGSAEPSVIPRGETHRAEPSSQETRVMKQETPFTDEETGRNLSLEIGESKIRGHELYTNWYSTSSKHPIRAPRAGLQVEHGYLYLHRARKGGLRMWMWFDDALCPRISDEPTTSSASGRWERVHSGHAHPTLEGHSLHVLEGDRPRWAGKAGVWSYQKKMRMKARMKAAV